MTQKECVQVRRWLSSSDIGTLEPDAEQIQHVAGCLSCQGALAALMAELVIAPPLIVQSCDAVYDELPAYLELEQEQGKLVAAQSFPQVWWHLWTCPECSQATADIKKLIEAEAAGLLPVAPLLPPKPRPAPMPTIRLDRHFLHAVFAQHLYLGREWSESSDALFLTEHRLSDCQVTIHVIQQGEQSWDLTIRVEPPLQGDIRVDIGDQHYRAKLVDGQNAHIRGIPSSLLADKNGPDLLISPEATQSL